jgi:hypothetical protein
MALLTALRHKNLNSKYFHRLTRLADNNRSSSDFYLCLLRIHSRRTNRCEAKTEICAALIHRVPANMTTLYGPANIPCPIHVLSQQRRVSRVTSPPFRTATLRVHAVGQPQQNGVTVSSLL